MSRPNWTEYFLGVAKAVSVRGDCRRSKVGAILVDRDRRIRGAGYNGAEPGGPSCLAGKCPRGLQSYEDVAPLSSYAETGPASCIALHAEQNLVLYTSPDERAGGTVYITREPCDPCLRMLRASGVIQIWWPEGYRIYRKNLDGRPNSYEWKRFTGDGS